MSAKWLVHKGNVYDAAKFRPAPFEGHPDFHEGMVAICYSHQHLIAAAPELLSALQTLFGMIESGQLVRDITHDHEPNWSRAAMKLVTAVSQAQQAIQKATGLQGAEPAQATTLSGEETFQ